MITPPGHNVIKTLDSSRYEIWTNLLWEINELSRTGHNFLRFLQDPCVDDHDVGELCSEANLHLDSTLKVQLATFWQNYKECRYKTWNPESHLTDSVIQSAVYVIAELLGGDSTEPGLQTKIRNRWSYALFSCFVTELSYLYLSALKKTRISLCSHSVPCAMAHWRLRAEWSVELSVLWMRSVRARRSERLLRSSRACMPRISSHRPISSGG